MTIPPPSGAAALGLLLGLGACALMPGADPAAPGAAISAAVPEPASREAPAPEVFDLTAPGLWDGRPSLGGIWVAHPDATTPERVRIRAGGAEIAGALFRRENLAAGPPFQLSSAAATALGIPPGTPRELAVTALRPVAGPAPDPAPVPAPDDAAAPADISSDPLPRP